MRTHDSSGRLRRLLAAGALAGAALVAGPGMLHARAEITDSGLTCHGSINGTDVAGVDSEDASQAISVPEGGSVAVGMSSDQAMSSYSVDLAFGFRGWQVASNDTSGNSWSNTVKVSDYSRFGVGLYRVTADSVGPTGSCNAAALVRVEGSPVPGTVAGDAAALLSGAALAGLLVSGGKAMGGGDPGGGAPEEIPTGILPPDDDWCFPGFILAVAFTLGAMAGGGGYAPSAPPQRLRRARWRPRVSGVAIVSGLVGAVGVVLLLQQYGRLFPTAAVVIRALVAGVLVALLVPSLLRIIPVSRYNRAVAARERAMPAAPAGAWQQPAPPPAPGWPPAPGPQPWQQGPPPPPPDQPPPSAPPWQPPPAG